MSVKVSFLWHMHQPFYKNTARNIYVMPWAFLHAAKDYTGMAALAAEFPSVHMTFNLAPSLIVQIDDYVAGTANDPFLDLMTASPASISPEDRRRFVKQAFEIPVRSMIQPFPRFFDLYLHHQDPNRPPFDDQELLDLQASWLLAWVDHDRRPPELAGHRGHFSEADRDGLMALARSIVGEAVPKWRRLSSDGVAELSASPFYHPILPLLIDSRVDDPSVPVKTGFLDDARVQLLRARQLFEERFGAAPKGLWPSEGSVSEATAALAASCGFEWMATDEGILAKSGVSLDGDHRHRLFRPFRHSALTVFFRDRGFSDLIGFHYMHGSPSDGAADLLARLRGLPDGSHVTIALDGENPWDYYLDSGRDFLRFLLSGIERDGRVEALTLSEARHHVPAEPLHRLAPGSWAGANFAIWMGHPEDHVAWAWIVRAREALMTARPTLDPQAFDHAYEALLTAEGSDWMWWFGSEFSTPNDPLFDSLFRQHIANVYLLAGLAPPEELEQPIKRGTEGLPLVMIPSS